MSTQTIRKALFAAVAALIIPACGKDGGAPFVPTPAGPVIPRTGPSVDLIVRGGNGSTGNGGSCFFVQISALTGSDIQIFSEGTINTEFTPPDVVPYLGTNPRTIAADLTLDVGSGLTAGVFTIDGDTPGVATGLHVLPGVTLTLRANFDTDNADGDVDVSTGTREVLQLTFLNGVYIEGDVQVGRKDLAVAGDGGTRHGVDVVLLADSYVTTSAATVDTRGLDAPAGQDGGNGGAWEILATQGLITRATCNTSGGTGDAGGSGGSLRFRSQTAGAYNTGSLTASGGEGTAGLGGNAGGIVSLIGSRLVGGSGHGPSMNSGNVVARGGDGTTGGGNAPGQMYWQTQDLEGSVTNSGNFDFSGGNCTGASGNGGNSCLDFQFVGDNASVRITGTLVGRGGNGAGPGIGGMGGRMEVIASGDVFAVSNPNSVIQGIYWGASLDVRGGDGADGGTSGLLFMQSNPGAGRSRPGQAPIILAGIASIDNSGGDGEVNGGNSGAVQVTNNNGTDVDGNPVKGGIRNEAELIVRGGRGNTGTGGASFGVVFATDAAVPLSASQDRAVVNLGAIDTSGGEGATTGGNGGSVTLSDHFAVENSGEITTTGGLGGGGSGGLGGSVSITAYDVAVNDAAITTTGGASVAGTGGGAGNVTITSSETTHDGVITARGGNTPAAVSGGTGGIVLIRSADLPTLITGSADVAGGTGTPAGVEGRVTLDGFPLALTNGAVTF